MTKNHIVVFHVCMAFFFMMSVGCVVYNAMLGNHWTMVFCMLMVCFQGYNWIMTGRLNK